MGHEEAEKRGEEDSSVGRSINQSTDSEWTIGKSLTLSHLRHRARVESIVRLIGLHHVLYIMAVLKMRFNDI